MGAVEGPRLAYTWTRTNVVPSLIPWLVLLGLLTLKPNRAPGAWWIWAAVLCSLGLPHLIAAAVPFLGGGPRDLLTEVLMAVGLGIAASWLLPGILVRKGRFLTWLAWFGVSVVFSLGFYLTSQSWGEAVVPIPVGAIVIGVCLFIISVALSLAGLITRKRYTPFRLAVWSAVMVAALASLVLMPFFIFALYDSPGANVRREFGQALGLLIGMNIGVLLVYLVLSLATAFYRERLRALLHLTAPQLVPTPAPAPEIEFSETK